MLKVLFIGLVWPEPTSSAAGVRMIQLIRMFCDTGFKVHFASAASKSPYSYPLKEQGVQEDEISLNDSSFNKYVNAIQPDIVVYDRFIIEEQYGWRVRESCPKALTILDTEDLHFLRIARQEAVKKNKEMDCFNDTAKRELAAIYRSDLSLIISKVELDLLVKEFNIPDQQLYFLPFLENRIEDSETKAWKTFEQRQHMMFIGNFLHEPNWNTVQLLKSRVWPMLRSKLPKVELHIYGAYASEKVYQLHQPKERFYIMDRAVDAQETMAGYRLLIAPIQFGAGAKGKFIDAMKSGTPSITTNIGAESMMLVDRQWNGIIEDDMMHFAEKAAFLYQDQSNWEEAQRAGQNLLNETYDRKLYEDSFIHFLIQMKESIESLKAKNFVGQILNSQQFNSNKYMSLWIEEKNRQK